MSTIEEHVKKVVMESLRIDDSSKVSESASYADHLGADSLDTVELIMALQDEFGCEIPDSDAEKIMTIGDTVRYIENALQ